VARLDALQRRAAKAGRDLMDPQLIPSLAGFWAGIDRNPISVPSRQKFTERLFAVIDQSAARGLALQLDKLSFCLPLRTPKAPMDPLALARRWIGGSFESQLPRILALAALPN
jgi:hypothetical protein